MDMLNDWLGRSVELGAGTELRIVLTFVVVVALWLLRVLLGRVLSSRIEDVRVRYRWRKGLTYGTVALVALIIGALWVEGIRSFATFLGLVSAGLAIALRDLVQNVAGWVFIVWRRPFRVGERIQVGEHAGDVIDIRLFQFTLLEIGGWVDADQSTGRIIHMPCYVALRDPIVNFSRGFHFIWDEIPVLVTFESDWRKAKRILAEIVTEHAAHLSEVAERRVREAGERFMIFYPTLTPTVYTRVDDSGVRLTMRYLTEPRKRRGTEEAIWEQVLDAFAEAGDIDFAYPTQRFYDHVSEGKPDMRPEG